MADPFTMIIASDVQLWWWRGSGNDPGHQPDCDDACKKQNALDANQLMVNAMNNITQLGNWPSSPFLTQGGGPVKAPRGIVMNGDLTATGRDDELSLYQSFYTDQLQQPFWPSLGNHDYALYANDCGQPFSLDNAPDYVRQILQLTHITYPGDYNYCCKQMVLYLRNMLSQGTVPNFGSQGGISCDLDSLAYSFDINNFHFVHLNNYPSYAREFTTPVEPGLAIVIQGAVDSLNQLGAKIELPANLTWEDLFHSDKVIVRSAIPWLANDLAAATAAGKKTVLFIHDCGDQWRPHEDATFMQVIKNQNIVAVFAGHIHYHHGYRGYIDTVNNEFYGCAYANPSDDAQDRRAYPGITDGHNPPGQYIPMFRSGSADYRTFLLAEFADTYMNVGVIDTHGGSPAFLAEVDSDKRDPVFARYDDNDEWLLATYPLLHYFDVFWTDQADIVYGAPLTGQQLNAVADVPATPTYTPPLGTVLPAGAHELHVTFTPDDQRYQPASVTVHIFVEKANPLIQWANPADIVYGAALGAEQLNATASVPGAFTYQPAAGAVLQAGSGQTLTVTFTPADSANYNTVSRSVQLNVLRATPQINWANPGDIDVGTPLGPAQLNARASWVVNGAHVDVPGAFSYTPPSGTILNVGQNQTLRVAFTPQDTVDYNPASAVAFLNVLHGHPVIESATFSPTLLQMGERVQVTLTVRNDSILPHITQGPEPGFEYSEGDNFNTKSFPSANGAFRVGVDLASSPYQEPFPYRWGFGKNLAPYESLVVTGYIRFHNRHENGQYFAGMIQESNTVVQSNQGPTNITVEHP